jgi:response regulator of citrate/malate metabolism
LYVVEYDHLPVDTPFASLKIFMKSSKTVQELFAHVIESEKDEVFKPIKAAMELIHPIDFKKVMDNMKLSEQRKALRKTAWSVVQDEVDERIEQARRETEQRVRLETELAEKRAIARQMKEDKVPIESIAKYTGLSQQEIADL